MGSAGEVVLTGAFRLWVAGTLVPVPHSVERVVVYLALADRPVSRSALAGALWLDADDHRAGSNLRTALWRLNRACTPVVTARDDRLVLAADVGVDYRRLCLLMRRLINTADDGALAIVQDLVSADDLLPDWEDEWVVADRERYRLLRLEALECAAAALIRKGHPERALELALAAVRADPLRESARRLVLLVQLAQGNVAAAIAEFHHYCGLLQDEVGLEPSPSLLAIVQPHLHTREGVTHR